jgi:hypothetical protein
MELGGHADHSWVRMLDADPESEDHRPNKKMRQVRSGHYVPVKPTPLPSPKLVIYSKRMAASLGEFYVAPLHSTQCPHSATPSRSLPSMHTCDNRLTVHSFEEPGLVGASHRRWNPKHILPMHPPRSRPQD